MNIMRSYPSLVIAILVTALSSSAQAQSSASTKAAESKKELIGTWEGFMADSDGSRHGDIKLEITEETITATNPGGGQVMGAGSYKVSGAGKKLKTIDGAGTSGQFNGKKYEGVFAIEGKTLRWCSANDNPRSRRPDKLQTNVQAGQFLMVLEKKG